MKTIITFFFLIFGLQTALADCASGSISFFPESKVINLHPKIMIEGYGSSQKTIEKFKKRKVWLVSEKGNLVELQLIGIFEGQMHLTQAIFEPLGNLAPNTSYTIKYEHQTLEEEDAMLQYDSERGVREKVSWKTTSIKAKVPLSSSVDSTIQIQFKDTDIQYYGCGPAANAVFTVQTKLDDEIWYKTELVELASDQKTIYYIRSWDGNLSVGHGMCAGAFRYKKTGKYKVRFTPVSIDGKIYPTTSWTSFESPYMKKSETFQNK
jgi:hypothetical protein